MIKNVVFDFGQVLVHFKEHIMIAPYIKDAEDERLVGEVLFDRLYWDRLDAGTITDEEVLAGVRSRLPLHLHEVVAEIYYNWIYNIPEMEGMRAILQRIKREYGVRVFVLSNISRYFAAHHKVVPILSEAEGCIFSSECGCVKPSAEIFAHLCKHFSILPEETLFIDDNEKNIAGAEAFGISGYLFDGNAPRLDEYLTKVLSK